MRRPIMARWAFLMSLASVALGACTWPSDRDFLASPTDDVLGLVRTEPAHGASAVPRDATLWVYFDRRPDPTTVGSSSVRLRAGTRTIGVGRSVDLVRCAVGARPHEPLRGLLFHQLFIDGVRSVEGFPQATDTVVGFQTSDASANTSPPPPPALSDLVRDVFAPRCGACHGSVDPDAGLDLTSAAAAAGGLVGRESRFRPGALLVNPGSHATSYLMAKLLDLPGIFGEPMPPVDGANPGAWPLRSCAAPDGDLTRIAAWIDAGALP